MASTSRKDKKCLNDEELLTTGKRVVIELEGFRLDNADQSGYIEKFDVYQGKAEDKFKSYEPGEVVLSLIESYWRQNGKIYFDNYFTSVNLLKKLETLVWGTVKNNRLPKDFKNDKNETYKDVNCPQIIPDGVVRDGAPPHVYNPVEQLLINTFGNRIISRHFSNIRSPCSPDINPADFWLWGYPTTLNKLKNSISQQIEGIQADLLENAVHSIEERLLLVEE
ncbi:hypothetical protein ILUMI_17991 [Ignelater luminosus]|uniref:PiggyBac transposable element-derived protein domain-containing protein n=1 Tax=Ignelater luminosus TaxID=2038154 RepID=A0A8K0CN13_IGNLU|nr:hypothetical protein ILUMI_17991 [Ignelater luminosus]